MEREFAGGHTRDTKMNIHQPKNVLVTSGAGFIGANFVRYLLTTTDDISIVNLDLLTMPVLSRISKGALRIAIRTFDLSYSTWGLDIIWPKLFDFDPVVVDEFTIKHSKPIDSSGAFYRYMRHIGVSPQQESIKLRSISVEKLRRLAPSEG